MKRKILSAVKRNKRRIIALAVIFAAGVLLAALGAYNANELFGGGGEYSANIILALKGLGSERARVLFFAFVGFVVLGIFAIVYASNSVNYKSDMYRVTPDIEIPYPAGQGQYGTSWFISEKELGRFFTKITVDEDSTVIRELLKKSKEEFDKTEKGGDEK